ncbi:hypothetical protein ABOM_006653 [Aspergillus bombycis]|uniref:Apple domain-containing protein n=1 Tax=Aspergillus bombycis TaxID=109264 RepID=A0A1F8A190_9EURO|nr:hypothetical protein ABOM_006653 [Aspergillus bombycis]OGM45095.1 hypothetical protein ABOM_006653 [Aspergillus bombycis]
MTIVLFWVTIAVLAPRVLAGLTGSTTTSATSTTSTSTAPSCTASLIDTLCDYPGPDLNFAVVADSRASCWDYCNNHQPCSFVIFNPGNPSLGTGTCWLYPGETFDRSKASSNCSSPYLEVYDKPKCSGGIATTTSGACTATATPSAVASICGYPAPKDCFNTCHTSTGAPNCLSLCAEADACSYVIFKPGQSSHSPYAPGTCWVYTNGTYDEHSAGTCSGEPEQFVYDNLCPKPSPSLTSVSPAMQRSSGNGTSSTPTGPNTSAATGPTTTSKNSAPTGLSLANPLPLGVAMLMWQAL